MSIVKLAATKLQRVANSLSKVTGIGSHVAELDKIKSMASAARTASANEAKSGFKGTSAVTKVWTALENAVTKPFRAPFGIADKLAPVTLPAKVMKMKAVEELGRLKGKLGR